MEGSCGGARRWTVTVRFGEPVLAMHRQNRHRVLKEFLKLMGAARTALPGCLDPLVSAADTWAPILAGKAVTLSDVREELVWILAHPSMERDGLLAQGSALDPDGGSFAATS